jgi:hypothetical protein
VPGGGLHRPSIATSRPAICVSHTLLRIMESQPQVGVGFGSLHVVGRAMQMPDSSPSPHPFVR